VERLARLLGRPAARLNPAHGAEGPRSVALIDAANCIGCTLCIQACPTDAILGAPKQMHTVLLAECTGCELCVKPCPVDCIEIVPLSEAVGRGAAHLAQDLAAPVVAHAARWRARYEARTARLARQRDEQDARLAEKAQAKLKMLDEMPPDPEIGRKRAAVRAAIERARARRNA
jgi:electron transport complex protein RnfB